MNNVLDTLPTPIRKMLRKPRGQGASRRGEILEAAKRLFIEEGFPHATMRRIASEVGVSPTALYLHFSDKEAILQAISEDFFAELLVELKSSQGDAPPTLERLRSGMRTYVKFSLDRADEYRLTFQTRQAKSGCAAEKPDVADMSFEVLEAAIQELLAADLLRPGDPVVIAETIWCALHGLTGVLIDLTDQTHTPAAALTESMIDMIIRGLACREAA
jgi:AcrR family transcriptional regulator